MAMPRAAAARATATSASGCTAWTPVGEMSTGIETGWPITFVAWSRSAGLLATSGAKPSWAKASRLPSRDTPASEPAMRAP